jgi:hypothetical protein
MDIWYSSWKFGIFFQRFGIFYEEKSGNPEWGAYDFPSAQTLLNWRGAVVISPA